MKKLVTSITAISVFLLTSLSAITADVEISWFKNPEPDVKNYNVRWALSPGGPVVKTITVSNATNVVISGTNFVYMTPAYFTVVAVNTSGLQGVPSDEVVWSNTNTVAPTKVLGIGARTVN